MKPSIFGYPLASCSRFLAKKGGTISLQFAESKSAQEAFTLVRDLQSFLVNKLQSLLTKDPIAPFPRVDWLRAQGIYGGESRYVATDERLFNRASVNICQVQYEKDPSKKLGSATAISSIVHPRNPFVPSVHIHVSWTEMKSGEGYGRIMGDLNPSLPSAVDKQKFLDAFHAVFPETLYRYGTQQGDRYFNIPALGRHRGVAHFYLEEYRSEKSEADQQLARDFGIKVIETYADIVQNILKNEPKVSADD